MDRVNETTKDCFDVIIQLRQKEAEKVPPPKLLHHSLLGVVAEMLRRATALGFSNEDARDMMYALVALLDETVLGKSDTYRQFWMSNPLQLHYFKENVAGDGFFEKLNNLRRDPHRVEVLRVYYLCLLFGFQGHFRVRGGEVELLTLIENVKRELERASPFDFDVLAPHGERPSEGLAAAKRKVSLLSLSVGSVGLALLVYGGFLISLDREVSAVRNEITDHLNGLLRLSKENP